MEWTFVWECSYNYLQHPLSNDWPPHYYSGSSGTNESLSIPDLLGTLLMTQSPPAFLQGRHSTNYCSHTDLLGISWDTLRIKVTDLFWVKRKTLNSEIVNTTIHKFGSIWNAITQHHWLSQPDWRSSSSQTVAKAAILSRDNAEAGLEAHLRPLVPIPASGLTEYMTLFQFVYRARLFVHVVATFSGLTSQCS
jgi:hypothetical protein